MPTLEALGINRLSVTERLMLVQAILDSVVAEQDPGIGRIRSSIKELREQCFVLETAYGE